MTIAVALQPEIIPIALSLIFKHATSSAKGLTLPLARRHFIAARNLMHAFLLDQEANGLIQFSIAVITNEYKVTCRFFSTLPMAGGQMIQCVFSLPYSGPEDRSFYQEWDPKILKSAVRKARNVAYRYLECETGQFYTNKTLDRRADVAHRPSDLLNARRPWEIILSLYVLYGTWRTSGTKGNALVAMGQNLSHFLELQRQAYDSNLLSYSVFPDISRQKSGLNHGPAVGMQLHFRDEVQSIFLEASEPPKIPSNYSPRTAMEYFKMPMQAREYFGSHAAVVRKFESLQYLIDTLRPLHSHHVHHLAFEKGHD